MEKTPIKITFPSIHVLGILWIIVVLGKVFGNIGLNWFFVLTFPIWAFMIILLTVFTILLIVAFFISLGTKND
jgi:hypothetical protein